MKYPLPCIQYRQWDTSHLRTPDPAQIKQDLATWARELERLGLLTLRGCDPDNKRSQPIK